MSNVYPHLSSTGFSTRERNWTWFGIFVLTALWVLLFLRLKTDWEVNPQYSYGWLVPVLAAWLLWRRWGNRPPAQPGQGGLVIAIVIVTAVLLLPIRLLEEANPEWRLVLWAHALVLLVICLAFVYYAGGGPWLRHFAFPLCFLLICVPWPTGIEQGIIQNLTQFVATVTVEIAGFMGIGAVQHGNLIELSRGVVGVEEACSGVRSLQTSIMIALFAGEAFRCTVPRRLLLLAMGLAFAFLLNLGRTTFLVWSAAQHGVSTIGTRHDTAGLLAAVALFIVLWFVARWWAAAAKTEARAEGALTFRAWPRALVPGLLMGAIAIEVATEAWYRAHEGNFVETPRWTVHWPTNRTGFRQVKISETAITMLRCDHHDGGAWRDEEDNQWLFFFLRWGAGKNSAQLAKSHTPDVCLPATGSKLIGEIGTRTVSVGGIELVFRQYAFEEQGRPLHVFHCIWEDRVSKKAIQLREDWTAASRIEAARHGKRHLGQRSLEIAVSGPNTPEQAQAALQRELESVLRLDEGVGKLSRSP